MEIYMYLLDANYKNKNVTSRNAIDYSSPAWCAAVNFFLQKNSKLHVSLTLYFLTDIT